MKVNREGRRVRGRTFSSGKDLVVFRLPFPSPATRDLSRRDESALFAKLLSRLKRLARFRGLFP